MKSIRTIALLALSIFALRGEAASALGGLSLPLPIDLPDIIGGRTPGGPGVDRDAYEQRADQVVNYSLNIKGLGDASASVYIIGFEPYKTSQPSTFNIESYSGRAFSLGKASGMNVL